MKLDANLNFLYADLPFAERFAAAVQDGFAAVEMLRPYEQPPDVCARYLAAQGLRLVLINMPTAMEGIGRMGLAAVPDGVAAFRAALERAVAVCEATGCTYIHVNTGLMQPGVTYERQRETLLENLAWAVAHSKAIISLEALSRADFPGYFYHQPEQVLEIVRTVNSPRVRLQFDFYHTAKEGLDVPTELERAWPWVGHIQVAGSPDRYEPDLSRDRYLEAFALLAERGYSGWIGCEYRPRTRAAEGLAWRNPLIEKGWLE